MNVVAHHCSTHPSLRRANGTTSYLRPARRIARALLLLSMSALAFFVLDVATANAQQPDLAAEKTNDVGGAAAPNSQFNWMITVENLGTGAAAIPDNALLLSDALPDGPTYGTATFTATGVTNPDALTCGVTSDVLTCRAVGDVVTLAAGAVVTVTLPTTPDATGTLVNPAAPGICRADPTDVVTESDDGGDPSSANNNCADTVTVAQADMTVSKSNDTGSSVALTDDFTWTLAVANAGAGVATFPDNSIILWDELPAAATYGSPTIAQVNGITAGQLTCGVQSRVLSCRANGTVRLPAATGGFSVEVLVTPTSVGVLSNVSTACSVDTSDAIDESNETNNSCSDSVTVTGVNLSVSKSTTSSVVSPGDTITYALAYENQGNELATGVTLSETVPVGTVFVAAGSGAWDCVDGAPAGSACRLNLPDLAGGDDGVALFKVRVPDPLNEPLTTITNVAEIYDDGTNGPDSQPGNNRDAATSTIDAFPNIVIKQRVALLDDADGDAVPSPGDRLRFTLEIENEGEVPAMLVQVTNVPDGSAPLVVGTVTAGVGTVAEGNTAGDDRVVIDLGTMAPGAQVDAAFDVEIVAPLPASVTSFSNRSTATGGNFFLVLSDDPNTPAPNDPNVVQISAQAAIDATMEVQLRLDADLDGVPSPGDQLRYVVVITNSGNRNASGVTFVDIPDPNTELVIGSAAVEGGRGVVNKGNTPGDANVEAAIGLLAGLGDSVTLSYAVTIDAALAPAVNNVVRQGIVGSDQLPNVLTDDPTRPGTEDAIITPVSSAALIVAEMIDVLADDVDGNGSATPGDVLEYVVTISNQGNQGAASVVFHNDLPAFVQRTSTPVATTQGTVTSGNATTDSTVTVDIGVVSVGESVQIRYQVRIDADLPVTERSIANQGTVEFAGGDDVNTDDPDTPSAGDPTITPISADVVIYSTLRDYLWSDVDDDRRISAGDVLLYRLDIYNFGVRAATNARVNVAESARLTLVSGSVQTSDGVVTVGNTAGDNRITIELATIAPSAHVIISFRMQVADVTGLQSIAQQTWTRFVAPDSSVFTVFSDDPDTPVIGDPTFSPLYVVEPPYQYLPLIWTVAEPAR